MSAAGQAGSHGSRPAQRLKRVGASARVTHLQGQEGRSGATTQRANGSGARGHHTIQARQTSGARAFAGADGACAPLYVLLLRGPPDRSLTVAAQAERALAKRAAVARGCVARAVTLSSCRLSVVVHAIRSPGQSAAPASAAQPCHTT